MFCLLDCLAHETFEFHLADGKGKKKQNILELFEVVCYPLN